MARSLLLPSQSCRIHVQSLSPLRFLSASSAASPSPSSASSLQDAKALLSESAVYLDNVSQTHVLPSTEDVIVSFANQVKQAVRMDRIARDRLKAASLPAQQQAQQQQAQQQQKGALLKSLRSAPVLGEVPASFRDKRIKNAEELVKTLYEAQLLSAELQQSVKLLHEVHRKVAALEAKNMPLPGNSPLLALLKTRIKEQEENLEDHRLLKWYKANLDACEALVLESNLLDQLVGKSDKNYATEGYVSFFEKVKTKRKFITALKGNQTQEQFAKETKATLIDILDKYAVGGWDEIKYLTSPTMLAALKNSHQTETQGGWEMKLKVKKVDPEVDLLDINEYSVKEYVPHFLCNHYAAITARFRYEVEYNLKNASGKLKFGGNLTKGVSFEAKELTFVRQLSQTSFDESQPVDTFRESVWKLVAAK